MQTAIIMSSQPPRLRVDSQDVASKSVEIDISTDHCTSRKRAASCTIDTHSPTSVTTDVNLLMPRTSKKKKTTN